jgi:GNAT superfamily N-acetyltransferase
MMQTTVSPSIRPVRPRDVGALRRVLAEANEEFRRQVADTLFTSYVASATDIEGRLAQGATVLIAEHRGILVGSISYYRDANDEGMGVGFPPGTAGIRATAVHPGARGSGIGRALIDACVTHALADHASSLALHTAAFMRAAMRLYTASGFQRAPAYDYPMGRFFLSDPGDEPIAMAFVRDIRPAGGT